MNLLLTIIHKFSIAASATIIEAMRARAALHKFSITTFHSIHRQLSTYLSASQPRNKRSNSANKLQQYENRTRIVVLSVQ